MATKRTQSQRPPGHQPTSQIFDPIYTSELDSDESVSTGEEQDPTYDYSSEEMDYLGVQDGGENVDAAMEDLEEVVDVVADEDDTEPPENEDMNGAESSEFEWDVSSRSRNRTSREPKSKVNQSIQQKNRQRVDEARRSMLSKIRYN